MNRGQATFGDFVRLANAHLADARQQGGSVTPGRDTAEISAGILHLVSVLARYTADQTKMIRQLPDRQQSALSSWDRASMQAHDLLMSAASVLRSGRFAAGRDHKAQCTAARQLHAAATALGAGRDLLQSHFTSDPRGARIGNSGWAPVMSSPMAARAQLIEIASLARRAAGVAEARLRPGYPLPETGDRLATAGQLLEQAASSVDEAARSEPITRAERDLLRSIPANVMPTQAAVGDPESVPALGEAVIASAQRAGHAAWTAAGQDPQSTGISIASWQRIAAAGMVTSHHCQVLCTTLADRTRLAGAPELHNRLTAAAGQAGEARDAWLDAAREFREITTDIRDHISPAAAEATELALWTGRLAYADPAWNLSSGPSHPARPAEALVPKLADVPDVVAVIHNASEAAARLAAANLEQATSAVRGQRVLVATRFLPEKYDIPNPFTPAPPSYQTSLLMCCEDTRDAARKLADTVAEIAIETKAPSRTIAAAHEAVRRLGEHESARVPRKGAREVRATPAEPVGAVESELRASGVTSPRALWRAAALDRAGRQLISDVAPRRARRDATGAQSGSPATWAVRQGTRAHDARRADEGVILGGQSAEGGLQAEP